MSANLIGRTVAMPTPCPRCAGTGAAIGHGSGPHAASLLCACGNHLGWLPQAAFDFVIETDKTFGATFEPIILRGALQHAKEVKMRMKDVFPKFDNTNRGVLFKNDNKSGESDPDYKGMINIDGRELWLSAWIKTSKKGVKFMSLSVKPKDTSNAKADAASSKATTADDMNGDTIPF